MKWVVGYGMRINVWGSSVYALCGFDIWRTRIQKGIWSFSIILSSLTEISPWRWRTVSPTPWQSQAPGDWNGPHIVHLRLPPSSSLAHSFPGLVSGRWDHSRRWWDVGKPNGYVPKCPPCGLAELSNPRCRIVSHHYTFSSVLREEPEALGILDRHSPTELFLQPFNF